MNLGRSPIILGLLIAGAGLLVILGDKLPYKPGRLPGDIVIRGKNSTFYFPLMTCIVLSLIGSVIFWFLGRR
jgi:hypothetical protein